MQTTPRSWGCASHLELHGVNAGVALHTIYREGDELFQGSPAETQAFLIGYAASQATLNEQRPPAPPGAYCEGTGRGPG